MSLVEDAMRKMQQTKRGGGEATVPAAARGEPPKPVQGVGERSFATIAPVTQLNVAALTNPMSDRIVLVDQPALREAGLLPPQHQERQISQQYRQIKRPLVANATGRGTTSLSNPQLIMMASAMPGEGKTFTSLNLAFSMTLEKDVRVLLVDADLPKPHISKLLGLESERGLLDALRNNALDVESLILPTNIPGLSLLPAGSSSETATELLASERMREVCNQLAQNDPRRIVLFDSPPLLLTTESQALAQAVGQIVIVVRADGTPQRTLLDAIDCLGEGRSVSLILNQSTQSPRAGYYYYGNAYGNAASQSANRT